MAFAGGGAFTAAKLSSSAGVPFPFPILIAAVAGAVLGVIVGLPALRVRGLSLAVVTLGFAEALYATVFANPTFENGSAVPVKTPSLWSYSLSPITHPMRFAVMVLIVLGIMAYFVMNLRRSASGQRMLAIRSNERSAAAPGINVTAVKLQGFALAAAIAAIGGALGAYQLGSASDSSFTAFASITLLTIVYIGGIATTSGAQLAGFLSTGGVMFTLLSGVTTSLANYWTMIGGIGLMVTAISQPDGAAVANMITYEQIRDKIKNRGNNNGPTQHGRQAIPPELSDVHA
jgi:branched-chain amino acid transport system permease protein